MTKTNSTFVKIPHKKVSNVSNVVARKSIPHDKTVITKYITVIDLTDDLVTTEYVTEVYSFIDIIDLTD